mgnify:CR=1 FL=1
MNNLYLYPLQNEVITFFTLFSNGTLDIGIKTLGFNSISSMWNLVCTSLGSITDGMSISFPIGFINKPLKNLSALQTLYQFLYRRILCLLHRFISTGVLTNIFTFVNLPFWVKYGKTNTVRVAFFPVSIANYCAKKSNQRLYDFVLVLCLLELLLNINLNRYN